MPPAKSSLADNIKGRQTLSPKDTAELSALQRRIASLRIDCGSNKENTPPGIESDSKNEKKKADQLVQLKAWREMLAKYNHNNHSCVKEEANDNEDETDDEEEDDDDDDDEDDTGTGPDYNALKETPEWREWDAMLWARQLKLAAKRAEMNAN
ncbi:hypothetical protein JOM56_013453 [Amanita muscaria]